MIGYGVVKSYSMRHEKVIDRIHSAAYVDLGVVYYGWSHGNYFIELNGIDALGAWGVRGVYSGVRKPRFLRLVVLSCVLRVLVYWLVAVPLMSVVMISFMIMSVGLIVCFGVGWCIMQGSRWFLRRLGYQW